CMQGLDFPLTF
nr:immunoglobulin light chain junction region [Macaca mulatta]MOV34999.1 immunoglobulin light chain junction region [Macaca mulatta]MOV35410.1 immunoglobulin light chain junction region [Macaca mulatta]MOV61001.1 immunoglobulin light chain junction region [Macaca mulatta]MOV61266.1 immunoglobulin light chain junction region [Macaca mulatta]